MGKDANISSDRAGDTYQRCGNSPAFVYSVDESYRPLLSKLALRGFKDAETAEAAFMLQRVSYNHMLPYLNASSRHPISGEPSVKEAHDLLAFDRRMQSVIFKFIGVFESQMRAQYSHWMETLHGQFAHHDAELFLRRENYEKAIGYYDTEAKRRIRKNRKLAETAKRNDGRLPIWHAVECMTLGTLSMLFANTADTEVTKQVSNSLGVTKDELSSWLRTIADVRNICAHFDPYTVRREIPSTPLKIKGIECDNRKPFYIVLILLNLLSCEFFCRDLTLIYTFTMRSDIKAVVGGFTKTYECPVTQLGFPENWIKLMDYAAGGQIVHAVAVEEK